MTREKAKQVLQAMWRYKECGYSEGEIRDALDIAIRDMNTIKKYQAILGIIRSDPDDCRS